MIWQDVIVNRNLISDEVPSGICNKRLMASHIPLNEEMNEDDSTH
jgi:hypothetical protein